MTYKVLITGGSGLLGSNLVKLMEDEFEVHAVIRSHEMKFKKSQVHNVDITEGSEFVKTAMKVGPQFIIHTAALTNVDYCETHRDEAWKTNVVGTKNVMAAARETKSKTIYISTDSVFDGKRGMYTEDDSPNPLNHYAFTKLEGEKVVSGSGLPYLIVRTNIYGWNVQKKTSIAEWIRSTLEKKNKITLFSDIFFTPILVNNLSDAIVEMMEKDVQGLYHVAGSERCSKLQFGLILARIFDLDKKLIEPIKFSDKNLEAERPRDPSLSIEKTKRLIKTELLDVREGLKNFKYLLNSGYVEELRKCLA